MSETMELFNYYSLDECIDKKLVIGKLKSLRNDGKIDYVIEHDIVNISDIDLEESDIEELTDLFDKNDIFPYLDHDDEDSEGEDESDYDEEIGRASCRERV